MEFCKIKKTRIAPSLSPKGEATPDRSRYHSTASPFGCQLLSEPDFEPALFPNKKRPGAYSPRLFIRSLLHKSPSVGNMCRIAFAIHRV